MDKRQRNLIYVYRFFGSLGFLFFIGAFFAELDFLKIRNDDQLMIIGLILAVVSFFIFIFFIKRKIHLYGGTWIAKISVILAILLIIFSLFILLFISTFNLNMI
jgi:hypothetical protein